MRPLRFCRALRHLTFEQIRYRLRYSVRGALLPPKPKPAPPGTAVRLPLSKRAAFISSPVGQGTDLASKRFEFLNETAQFGPEMDWEPDGQTVLWTYNLHYFDYLAAANAQQGRDLVEDWMASSNTGPGWKAFPTACRVINWAKFLDREFPALDDPGFLRDAAASLWTQTDWVRRNLERHISGNHLLKDAVALVFGGTVLGDSEFAAQGECLLRETVREQMLPDGGHYERSPMYHALVLLDLLDSLNIQPEGSALSEELAEAAGRALGFLRDVQHPDGEIALFNDSALGIAPSPGELAEYARRIGVEAPAPPPGPTRSRPDSGYYRLESKRLCAIADAGPAGPDHLLAHAHSDMLSFEMSAEGRRAIVDGGVFDYEPGPMRQYCRSTAAHSTVSVENADACECFGVFRAGRRPRRVAAEWTRRANPPVLTGWHDGYKRLGAVHRRTFALLAEDALLVVDHLDGRGRRRIASRLHFSPECRIAADLPSSRLTADLGGLSLHAGWTPWPGPARVESAWHCPRFGLRQRNPVLLLEATVGLPFAAALWISLAEAPEVELTKGAVSVKMRGKEWRIRPETGIVEG